MSRCCNFHAVNSGPPDQPCRWAYAAHVSVWQHTDGRIAHTLDHGALVQGHTHVEPAGPPASVPWCACGWRNVGILLVEAPTDPEGGLLRANFGEIYHAVRVADRGIQAREELQEDASDLIRVKSILMGILGLPLSTGPAFPEEAAPGELDARQVIPRLNDKRTVIW